jgi:hypothetical protein
MKLRRTTALLALAGFVYARRVRPWFLNWGATDEEIHATLPGDDFVPEPEMEATRAITVDAPPEQIWPWLVQIGQDKAGFYSYAWLENLVGCDMHNANQIVPEWQDINVGDPVLLHPKAPPLRVNLVEPGRSLVLEDDWSFHLRPEDGGKRTRLIVRSRGTFKRPDLGPIGNFFYWRLLFEPAHFIMEQKMMRGIKERAEREARRRETQSRIEEVLPDTRFQGETSVAVQASPEDILRATNEVSLQEMPVARLLGEARYLPARVLGRTAGGPEPSESFMDGLLRSGSVKLIEEPGREVVIGGAGKYHQVVDQEVVPLSSAEQFASFDDPECEKLAISIRAEPSGTPGESLLTLEHRTAPLSDEAAKRFARYWLVIKPTGNFVSKQLLLAIKRRAERHATQEPVR